MNSFLLGRKSAQTPPNQASDAALVLGVLGNPGLIEAKSQAELQNLFDRMMAVLSDRRSNLRAESLEILTELIRRMPELAHRALPLLLELAQKRWCDLTEQLMARGNYMGLAAAHMDFIKKGIDCNSTLRGKILKSMVRMADANLDTVDAVLTVMEKIAQNRDEDMALRIEAVASLAKIAVRLRLSMADGARVNYLLKLQGDFESLQRDQNANLRHAADEALLAMQSGEMPAARAEIAH